MTLDAFDLAVLAWLAESSPTTALVLAEACGLTPGEVRGALTRLESAHQIVGHYPRNAGQLRRVYTLTAEGRRKAGISAPPLI